MKDLTNIAERAKNGDKKAFEHLYYQTKDKVYFLCLKFLKNEADALDIVSDTYLTAIEKLHTLQQPEYFETWLKKIAANKCKNYLVKNKAVLFSEQDEMERYAEDTQFEVDDEFIPESYVESKEKQQQIMDIIDNQLSDVQRSVILMYYYGEISVREIASELECSEGTVKSRLNSARTVMKKYITDMQKGGKPLFSVGNIPLFTLLLQEAAKGYTVSEAKSTEILQGCFAKYDRVMQLEKGSLAEEEDMTPKSESLQETTLKKGVGNMMKKTVMSKIAIVAAGIVIVGIAATVYFFGGEKTDQDTYAEHPEQEQTIPAENDKTEDGAVSEEIPEKNDNYILPDSNVRYIEYTEILDFDTETLNLAKNEIYARHGFIFITDSIAEYFEACAWYNPSVPAADFNDSVFNEYEIANIVLLEEYEKFSGYTYPLEVKNGETVKVDLNGDGKLEKISLSMKKEKREEDNYYDNKIVITVDDTVKKYINDSYEMTHLYVVDIDTKDNAKEICFDMWEPNDYTGSIFWQYSTDNELKKIWFGDDMLSDTENPEHPGYEYPNTYSTYGIEYLGDGRINVFGKHVGITQYFAYSEYQLTEDGHFEYIDRIYEFPDDLKQYFHDDSEIVLTLKKELAIHKEPSESSETFVVKPQKLKVVAICANPDENSFYCWSKVELEDGSTGWILPAPNTGQIELEETFDGTFFSG